jgi:hypothetical protein
MPLAEMRVGGQCTSCQSFLAQRDSAYPESFRQLLDQLGINPSKEREVYEIGPAAEGKSTYGGWFYFVGEMLERRPLMAAVPRVTVLSSDTQQ